MCSRECVCCIKRWWFSEIAFAILCILAQNDFALHFKSDDRKHNELFYIYASHSFICWAHRMCVWYAFYEIYSLLLLFLLSHLFVLSSKHSSFDTLASHQSRRFCDIKYKNCCRLQSKLSIKYKIFDDQQSHFNLVFFFLKRVHIVILKGQTYAEAYLIRDSSNKIQQTPIEKNKCRSQFQSCISIA